MRTRIVQVGAAIAAVAIALIVARTEAFAAGKESCSTTTTDVTSGPSADGAEATCDAASRRTQRGEGPSLRRRTPTRHPRHQNGSDATATANGNGLRRDCRGIDGGSDAEATAKGDDADATAEAVGPSGSDGHQLREGRGLRCDCRRHQAAARLKQPRRERTPMRHRSRRAGGSHGRQLREGKGHRRDCRGRRTAATLKATASGTDSEAEASAEETGSNVTASRDQGFYSHRQRHQRRRLARQSTAARLKSPARWETATKRRETNRQSIGAPHRTL